MGVKHAILGLLHFGDMHGYRIKELLQRDFGHMWTVNFGQIYPALRDMREEGLVTMSRVEGDSAPDRKLYSITEEGRAEFRRWLESEPERGLTIRDPFLLRFAFFGFGEASLALERVDEQIALYEEQLEHRRGKAPRRTLGNVQARLLSELGLMLNESMLEWLRRAKEEIKAEAAGARPRRAAEV